MNIFEKKLREKIAKEILEELCGCDCGDEHCFDSGILEASVAVRMKSKFK